MTPVPAGTLWLDGQSVLSNRIVGLVGDSLWRMIEQIKIKLITMEKCRVKRYSEWQFSYIAL